LGAATKWEENMGKLLAAAVVLIISMGPSVSSAAPSIGAKPLESASPPVLQDVRYYRHHHHYRYHYRHHYRVHRYYRHHRHYW
jgi:hypothetical protein